MSAEGRTMPDAAAEGRRYAADEREVPTGTVPRLFFEGLDAAPDAAGMRCRDDAGRWTRLSRAEVAERVRNLSLGLRALELPAGAHVGIMSHTRLEWALADFAAQTAGFAVVTVYPTLPADQMAFILRDGEVKLLFASDAEQLAKVHDEWEELPDLERVVLFDPLPAGGTAGSGAGGEAAGDDSSGKPRRRTGREGPEVLDLAALEERGAAADEPPEAWREGALRARPESLSTLIYTSGTTGTPKGVMLTHANLYANTAQSMMVLPISASDRALSWLPLSHALERTAGLYVMWRAGAEIAYADSPDTVASDMVDVRPTVMIGVPRMYEKFYETVEQTVAEGGWIKRMGFPVAKWFGERHAEKRLAGEEPGPLLRLGYRLADRVVFRKLRERTGGRVRYFISGAAPLSADIGRFFYSGGLVVLEGYGLTETSPVTNVNPPDDIRFGTVGPVVAGTEVKIAEDGEILFRGPQVMRGYWKQEEETAEALEPDGWFHTGDIGELDADGYLRVTDRKKNIIVTAAGKNVAPQPIEERIARSPYVDQVVILGDRRKFPLAVVVPSFQAFKMAFPGRALDDADRERLADDPRLTALIEEDMRERTRSFASYERPKRALLVARPFSVEDGTLTPTLKVKRRVVAERLADRIDRLYREAEREERGG